MILLFIIGVIGLGIAAAAYALRPAPPEVDVEYLLTRSDNLADAYAELYTQLGREPTPREIWQRAGSPEHWSN